MKLLYLTDTHIRGTSPRNRLDDFAATMQAKLREAVALAREHQVTAILHGGDLFDRPDVAPAVALEFLRVLMEAPCPIYGIAGNHDVFGYNPETVPRTMLGILDGVRIVRLIRPGELVWLEENGLRVQITGQEFHAEIDRREPILDYCVVRSEEGGSVHVREPEADFAVHLTHGMLLEKPFGEWTAYTLLDRIADKTKADITFGGHYHPGFSRPVIEMGGRLFVNPGALARLGAQAADMRRPVQVVLVELERGRPPTATVLPLQSAPLAEEVLDRSGIERAAEREVEIANFLQAIAEAGQFEELEIQKIMERTASVQGVSEEVRTEALRRLGLAQEELAQGGEEEFS